MRRPRRLGFLMYSGIALKRSTFSHRDLRSRTVGKPPASFLSQFIAAIIGVLVLFDAASAVFTNPCIMLRRVWATRVVILLAGKPIPLTAVGAVTYPSPSTQSASSSFLLPRRKLRARPGPAVDLQRRHPVQPRVPRVRVPPVSSLPPRLRSMRAQVRRDRIARLPRRARSQRSHKRRRFLRRGPRL